MRRKRRWLVMAVWTGCIAAGLSFGWVVGEQFRQPASTSLPDEQFRPFLPTPSLEAPRTADPSLEALVGLLRASDAPESVDDIYRVSPTAAPTPRPKPQPKPAPTSQPKLAGGAYKPWRTFGPNVQAARNWLIGQLSRTSWRCIDVLFDRESRWRTHAGNRFSGAYGIPQALPGSKMSWAGDDWKDNAVTQVKWGLHYIKGRYGNACVALDHSYRTGWY